MPLWRRYPVHYGFLIVLSLVPACQRQQLTPPPPPATCTPPANSAPVPVKVYHSGNDLKIDPPDVVRVSVCLKQFVQWSADDDPDIVDIRVAFKPLNEDDTTHKPKKPFDKPDCSNKKCHTKVPTIDQYGNHPYLIVASLANGKLLVLDPQVTVDP